MRRRSVLKVMRSVMRCVCTYLCECRTNRAAGNREEISFHPLLAGLYATFLVNHFGDLKVLEKEKNGTDYLRLPSFRFRLLRPPPLPPRRGNGER